jgi:hypothetical protein
MQAARLVFAAAGVWAAATLLSLFLLAQPGPPEFLGSLVPIQHFMAVQLVAVPAALVTLVLFLFTPRPRKLGLAIAGFGPVVANAMLFAVPFALHGLIG